MQILLMGNKKLFKINACCVLYGAAVGNYPRLSHLPYWVVFMGFNYVSYNQNIAHQNHWFLATTFILHNTWKETEDSVSDFFSGKLYCLKKRREKACILCHEIYFWKTEKLNAHI